MIELAADIALAGMDPLAFLGTEDPVEAIAMLAITKRWLKRKLDLDRNLAREIINNLAKSMRSGTGGG